MTRRPRSHESNRPGETEEHPDPETTPGGGAHASECSHAEPRGPERDREARNLVELAPVGIFRTEASGATTFVNRKWCEIYGVTDVEALGVGWLTAVHPDDRPELERVWTDATRCHEASSAEYRIVHRDGSVIWVTGHAIPETDADGRVVGYIGTVADITDRKRAEAALRESNDLLSEFIRHSPIYAFIKEVKPDESRVLRASENYREMVGIPGSEMAGKTMSELFPPEFASKITDDDWAVVSRGEVLKLDEDLDGRTYTTIKFPIALEGAHFLAGYTIDITERKRAEEALMQSRAQLLQAQKLEAVGRLAGGVAHDFNNILQAVLSLATVLRLRVGTPELAKIVAEIEAHVMRGAALTQQLLLFSRRQKPQTTVVDLGGLASDSGALLRRLIPENILLTVEPAPRRLWVDGDATQLEQVLMNLVVNAKDAMPDGGSLTVRAAESSGEAVLEVTDTGHGIDEATLARLFEPFFTTKETGRGTGLGLSVVHGIVEQHGGRIEVESTPGGGSVFRVFLPVITASEAQADAPQVPADIPMGAGERLLVVEDEPGVRAGLERLLSILGYTVTAVANGEDAIALAADPAPDLLLTDLMLPGIDGAALASVLRERWPSLDVMVMSGYAESEAVRSGVDDETLHFLQKPFDIRTLACRLRAAIEPSPRGRP